MSEDTFSFAFIADAQIGMASPKGLKGPDSDKSRLLRAIEYINGNDISFVIFGGDQIDDGAGGDKTEAQLDVLQECLSALNVPHYGVVGNHDQLQPGEPSAYVDRGMPMRFSLSYRNAYFVGINASWLRGDCGDDAQWQEWLYMKDRFSHTSDECVHRFVILHWPLFNVHPDEEDTYWNMPNRDEIIELFKKEKVSCVLCGHWQQDIDARWRGISLITSVGTATCLQYPEERSFKVVTVFKDGWSARRVSVSRVTLAATSSPWPGCVIISVTPGAAAPATHIRYAVVISPVWAMPHVPRVAISRRDAAGATRANRFSIHRVRRCFNGDGGHWARGSFSTRRRTNLTSYREASSATREKIAGQAWTWRWLSR